MRLAALAILPLVFTAAAAHSPAHPAHRRHAALAARQDTNGTSSDVSSTSPSSSAPSSTTTPVPTTTAPTTTTQPPTTSTTPSVIPSNDPVTSSSVLSSADPSPSSSATLSSADPTTAAPTTAQSTSDVSTAVRTTTTVSKPGVKTATVTSSQASSTATAAPAGGSSSGLPKPALIAIIVVAAVIGTVAIAWTLFRKWKLRPSNRFDSRLQPIDFSPTRDNMGDNFLEKTLQRSTSVSSADRQRQQFVADLDKDPGLVGDLQHDFTAGPATNNMAMYAQYDDDPYAADPYRNQAGYDFSTPREEYAYPHHDGGVAYPAHPEAAATYPPQPGYSYDYPTQDTQQDAGYANLQRGPSVGGEHAPHAQGQQPFDPMGSDFAIGGRPTGGGLDGPYAQAATYRY